MANGRMCRGLRSLQTTSWSLMRSTWPHVIRVLTGLVILRLWHLWREG